MNDRLKKILAFATKAHGTQTRKGNGEPYINHPIRVAESVGVSNDLMTAAAYLHDVLEDCPNITGGMLFDEVRTCGFSIAETVIIVNTVCLLSRFDKGINILGYLEAIKPDFYARTIKLADLADNIRDLSPGNLLDKYHLCEYYLTK